jgi:hypothetical protein
VVVSLRTDNRQAIQDSNNRDSAKQDNLNNKTSRKETLGNSHKENSQIKVSEARLNSNLP